MHDLATLPGHLTKYLCVDRFIRSPVEARSLKTAFELGMIDRLMSSHSAPVAELAKTVSTDGRGMKLLIDLLVSNDVVEQSENQLSLTDNFRTALAFRDLLLAKVDFANLVAPDFIEHFTQLIVDPPAFMREARIFKLFDYSRALQFTPENEVATRRWMSFTTMLTRYEAPVLAHCHDFGRVDRILDVGGNSGELVLQICKRHPQIDVTVLDLPVVCRVGQKHVAGHPEARRIHFLEANSAQQPFPSGFDVVIFKSMLHDWLPQLTQSLLANAMASLNPGGTVLIFERSSIDVPESPWPYSDLPMLLFFRSFRSETFYGQQLQSLGYQDVQSRRMMLEMPFFLVTAKKPK
jgi:ubiquinone/menaquinone biosynthesis C-methylase UbiE